MIKAILFDLDGVVVDSEPLYQQAEKRMFGRYGITIPDEDWSLFRGVSEERFYQLAIERYNVPITLEQLRNEGRSEVLEAFSSGLKFMDGFERLYDQLVSIYQLGLVTSTPQAIFESMDLQLQLRELFPRVLTGEMTPNNKPHPQPYLTMMADMQVNPDEVVIIEDSIHGLQAAWSSGAWTIALRGSVPEEEMPQRHLTISRLSEIDAALISALPETIAAATQ